MHYNVNMKIPRPNSKILEERLTKNIESSVEFMENAILGIEKFNVDNSFHYDFCFDVLTNFISELVHQVINIIIS